MLIGAASLFYLIHDRVQMRLAVKTASNLSGTKDTIKKLDRFLK
jgi:hypothetical protein